MEIDQASSTEIVSLISQEDLGVAMAVKQSLAEIAEAVDAITARLEAGGRLLYIGSGSSGRMGVLDAAECLPTFGISPESVQAIISGGIPSMWRPGETAEDDPVLGQKALRNRNLSPADAVVAISASGTTRFTVAAARFARLVGAFTVAITCNQDTPLSQVCDLSIEALVGPEVIAGSTRMKAATAQKMILNMISTASMIRLGHVYSNLMVNLHLSNRKLVDRGVRIIAEAVDVPIKQARAALKEAGDVRSAIVMLQLDCGADEARGLVSQSARVNEILKKRNR